MKIEFILAIVFVVLCIASYVVPRLIFKKKKDKRKIDYDKVVVTILKPGDFYICWGMKLVSWLVWLKDGVKDAATHCMHQHSYGYLTSAEATGYKKLFAKQRLKDCRRFIAYRFKNASGEQLQSLQKETQNVIGTGYDYAKYLIHVIRVLIISIPLVFFWIVGDWKKTLFLFFIVLIIRFPVVHFLKKWERFSFHCAEIERKLYCKAGLLATVFEASNATPTNNHDVLTNLVNAGVVEIVFDTANPPEDMLLR